MASTWSMVGLIWFVQLVHYPLFARYPGEGFSEFAREHQQRTGWVVVPPMLLELGTAVALAVQGVGSGETGPFSILVVTGLALLGVVWGSTFLLQVPCHRRLVERDLGVEQRAETIARLVRTNWLRTVAWSLRGIVAALLVLLIS